MREIWIAAAAAALVAAGFGAGALFTRRASAPITAGERKILFYRDPMNPQITSPTPKMSSDGMSYVPVYEGEGGPAAGGGADRRGIWIEPRMTQNSGVRAEAVKRRSMSRVIRTVGQVTYDERRLFNMNAKFRGWVEKLYVDYTGKRVRKGDPLMEIYSPDLVTTQEEYLLALRHRKSLPSSSLPEVRAAADELVRSARQRLVFFDVPVREIQGLEQRRTPKKSLMINSPATGYVIEKSVLEGAQVMPGAPLFKIADLSNVWVLADVYQYELAWVKPGLPAEVELSYLPGRPLTGTVTYIYPYLATETRTVKVRIEVRRVAAPGELKPDMFATVVIRSPVAREAVAVPEQAIIHAGSRNIAVLALGDGYFEPREVKLGVTAEGYVEVLDGIAAGDKIVTTSQFLIDAESNLRSAVAAMSGGEGAAPPVAGTGESSEDGHAGHQATSVPVKPTAPGHPGHEGMRGMSPDAGRASSGGREGMHMGDAKRP